ncbi:hypothetical protein J5Y03_01290 [Bacillus sp. RG28]|uniref:Uncharacterized protein n=1 Tax=Gottfriedia endophytica TaxID=2820819 RepID=A0A940SIH6_9BACI|nr:hypothetical protein [Gottfriedia endophytica]MBP0723814.1 hypothetical protein [Gottfriedia endophytica]
MNTLLTEKEKATYLRLLKELMDASTECEIKKIEIEILCLINTAKNRTNPFCDLDEQAATIYYNGVGLILRPQL